MAFVFLEGYMASSSNDPTTGAPVFLDADAPDPAVNPTEVAAFAASVGTRLIGTTTQRTAYAYTREGLRWYDTTLDTEYAYNGSGWERVFARTNTYTPSWTSFTPGPSTVDAWYQVVGKFCEGTVDVTLAAGWSMASDVVMSLPVTAADPAEGRPIGQAIYVDSGTGYFKGRLMMSAGGAARLMWEPDASFLSGVKSNEPFTWANGDKIGVQFRYEVA